MMRINTNACISRFKMMRINTNACILAPPDYKISETSNDEEKMKTIQHTGLETEVIDERRSREKEERVICKEEEKEKKKKDKIQAKPEKVKTTVNELKTLFFPMKRLREVLCARKLTKDLI